MSVANADGYRGFPLPIGTLLPYAGVASSINNDTFLFCDGGLHLKADYPELAEVLGTIYGVPLDADYFYVPDTIGNFVEGTLVNAGTIIPPTTGTTLTNVALTENEMPTLPSGDFVVNSFTMNASGDYQYLKKQDRVHVANTFETSQTLLFDSNNFMGSININLTSMTLSRPAGGANVPILLDTINGPSMALTYYIKAKY